YHHRNMDTFQRCASNKRPRDLAKEKASEGTQSTLQAKVLDKRPLEGIEMSPDFRS
ncbi:hypothetical protein STEG23_014653, partial [Scotinomys teguina]